MLIGTSITAQTPVQLEGDTGWLVAGESHLGDLFVARGPARSSPRSKILKFAGQVVVGGISIAVGLAVYNYLRAPVVDVAAREREVCAGFSKEMQDAGTNVGCKSTTLVQVDSQHLEGFIKTTDGRTVKVKMTFGKDGKGYWETQ